MCTIFRRRYICSDKIDVTHWRLKETIMKLPVVLHNDPAWAYGVTAPASLREFLLERIDARVKIDQRYSCRSGLLATAALRSCMNSVGNAFVEESFS